MLSVVMIGGLGFAATVILLLAIAYLFQECYNPETEPPDPEGDLRDEPEKEPLITPMRALQKELLENGKRANELLETSMIIGIYATLKTFAAYCINFQTRHVQFYSVKKDHFPWQLFDLQDNTEFQMRNFSFALMAFYEEIKAVKQFSIYVASDNTTFDNNRLGRRATKLLDHYISCEGTSVANEGSHFLNPYKDKQSFAIKITPAEDLSENDFESFVYFVSTYYQIPRANFIGSHRIPHHDGQSPGPSSHATEHYQGYINKVKELRLRFSSPCTKCGYYDNEVTHRTSNAGLGTSDWSDTVTVHMEDV